MDFYEQAGKLALGSRLRRLSERLTEQGGKVYELYNIDMHPKWFPVFYALAMGGEKSIMQIAQQIGHSHPSVSTIVKEMTRKGLVSVSPGAEDGRKNYVRLTAAGLEVNERIQAQFTDVHAAVERALAETQHDLWKAIAEWEFLLEQKDLLQRVKYERKLREMEDVQIIGFQPEYQADFRRLNEEWISAYFKMEEADYAALDHPQEHILDGGGEILFALYKNKPVGTCALIRMDNETFELAKMAVSAEAKGKGIGMLLGNAIIAKAREKGAAKLHLGSNTLLKPAINLYHKLGFKKVTGIPSPYERCNIQMDLIL